jgi:hypothetical protein
MKRCVAVALSTIVVALIGSAAPAVAQMTPRTQPVVRRPLPRPKPKLSKKLFVRAEGLVGFEHFTASETFKGIFGSANNPIYGGGVDVVRGHLFVRGEVTHFGKTGERAFASNGEVFRLGIPLKVSITPVVGAAGYRGIVAQHLVAYAGGGVGSWSYSESDDDPSDSFSTHKTGYLALGGVEWRLRPLVGLGFEAQYAAVPNGFPASTCATSDCPSGGLAAELGEKDMGGAAVVVRFIVGRW